MGLRAGAGTTGRFPGSKDLPFVARCQTFFRHQLRAQQPRIVLALGAWVPAFLAPLAGRLQPWTGIRSLAGIDAAGPVQDEVSFGDDIASCSVVALTHPSLRGPNVGRRKYGGEHGHAAELKMVQEAMSASGVTERIA